ncbi:MAG: hypothetical protein ACPGWM_08955, partial [Flavobacteriales bacterium]
MDKERILQATNGGLDIYQYVLDKTNSGIQLKVGANNGLLNPFYEDKNGSLSISFNQATNQYHHNDFGDENYKGDAFDFYAQMEGLSSKANFIEIIKGISQNVLNQPAHNYNKSMRKPAPLTMVKGLETKGEASQNKTQDPSNVKMEFGDDFDYWNSLFPGIKDIKRKANQFGLSSLTSFVPSDRSVQTVPTSNPLFAFEVQKGSFKMYRPFAEKVKHWWILK